MKLSTSATQTLKQLKEKAKGGWENKTKMPSLKSLHNLLNELNIQNSFGNTTHIVEFRTGLSPIVNDRHDGANGHSLKVWSLEKGKPVYSRYGAWSVDSSSSYYSWNTYVYAKELLNLLKERKLIK